MRYKQSNLLFIMLKEQRRGAERIMRLAFCGRSLSKKGLGKIREIVEPIFTAFLIKAEMKVLAPICDILVRYMTLFTFLEDCRKERGKRRLALFNMYCRRPWKVTSVTKSFGRMIPIWQSRQFLSGFKLTSFSGNYILSSKIFLQKAVLPAAVGFCACVRILSRRNLKGFKIAEAES
jgi:hypothetical protein